MNHEQRHHHEATMMSEAAGLFALMLAVGIRPTLEMIGDSARKTLDRLTNRKGESKP